MEQKLDLTDIDPQKLDPKQEKELFAALSDEELAEVAGGAYVQDGHVCGSNGYYDNLNDAKFDFTVGTRVQVTRCYNTWSSWSATIIDRKIKKQSFRYAGTKYCVMYLVHFDHYTDEYDDWYEQSRLYI